jgi:hypothetical protein
VEEIMAYVEFPQCLYETNEKNTEELDAFLFQSKVAE